MRWLETSIIREGRSIKSKAILHYQPFWTMKHNYFFYVTSGVGMTVGMGKK
jgi:hypothetical protein